MNADFKQKYEIMKENAYTLAKRIDKAVEFVEKWKYEDGDGSVFFDINTNPTELLDILKGVEK